MVAEVARAKQELEVVKAEASGQVLTLARTAEVRGSPELKGHGTQWGGAAAVAAVLAVAQSHLAHL